MAGKALILSRRRSRVHRHVWSVFAMRCGAAVGWLRAYAPPFAGVDHAEELGPHLHLFMGHQRHHGHDALSQDDFTVGERIHHLDAEG